MTFTSAEFTMDMFEAANAIEGKEGTSFIEEVRSFNVVGNKITIPYKIDANTIYIRGMVKATAPVTGKYSVTVSDTESVVTFAEGDFAAGDAVQVFYDREVADVHTLTMTTSAPSARGAVTARWPLYAGSKDGAEAAIKGYLQIEIPLCRVTALPGFDTSLTNRFPAQRCA